MKKYAIAKDFKILCGYKPPINKFIAWLGRTFWWLVPKGKKDKAVESKKIVLKSTKDGAKFFALLFQSASKTRGKGAKLKSGKKSQNDTVDVNKKTSCLIYFHGGAFVFGPIWAHYRNAQRCVKETGCKVFFVRYRLAPRYPYPKGTEDCEQACRYLLDHADEFGVDKDRIAVGGDSAGGFMATWVARYMAQSLNILPKMLMLLYPVISPDENYPSMQEFEDAPVWNTRANKKMWKLFAQGKDVDCHWDCGRFAKIPAVYVETAQFDCLRDPAKDFAEKIRQKGGCVVLNQTVGTPHGYDVIGKSKVTEDNIKKRMQALREV